MELRLAVSGAEPFHEINSRLKSLVRFYNFDFRSQAEHQSFNQMIFISVTDLSVINVFSLTEEAIETFARSYNFIFVFLK